MVLLVKMAKKFTSITKTKDCSVVFRNCIPESEVAQRSFVVAQMGEDQMTKELLTGKEIIEDFYCCICADTNLSVNNAAGCIF
jgi:hypothetical protein